MFYNLAAFVSYGLTRSTLNGERDSHSKGLERPYDVKSLILYRGLTVRPNDADMLKTSMLSKGFAYGENRQWSFECIDLRPKLDCLFEKPDLSLADTRPMVKIDDGNGGFHSELVGGYPVVCACADELGASYYALRHNRNESEGVTHGLVIKFRVNLKDISIDGRDFLYNSIFRDAKSSAQRDLACKLFGNRVGVYLDRAMQSQDFSYRIAMCDLAVQDDEVVLAHARNRKVIGGRYNTIFKSAFFVKVPIPPADVISVSEASDQDFTPQVTLDQFRILASA